MRAVSLYGYVFLLVVGMAHAVAQQEPGTPIPLNALVEEARRVSPQVIAAERQWDATKFAARQASALPDTQLMVQHLAVGSPRPFAGYSNSEFAYIGFGASQELPFPGKRSLRGEVARRTSDIAGRQTEVTRSDVIERLKLDYFRLAYLQQTLSLLQENDHALGEIEQVAETRYKVGQGTQQDVLKAQLQHTKILNEIAMQHREVGELQAEIKALLNRSQQSANIVTELLSLSALPPSAKVEANPELQVKSAEVERSHAALDLARRETKPDFNVQYMWQHTSGDFRDYYMATFGIRLPNRGRVRAQIDEANAKREQAKAEYDAAQRTLESEIQKQIVSARNSEEQLKIYGEGLIPQSEATLRASISGYQNGKQDFETLLSAFNDVVRLKIEYQQQLVEHESAVARLERLTGVTQ